ncbi:hypothetical protein PR048_014269 [Dryococelus australis]|uniref:Uncharacterized protein n=1 Tax=Dryococelus australis TaxID=614101 RepID=A0ABQ9HDT5_9NEOP|nr:hypothetical protein PR048_014269 [Dryococelus australis]
MPVNTGIWFEAVMWSCDGRVIACRAVLWWPRAAVAELLACSFSTKACRVQSPAGSLPDFRIW